ncbi:HlyD family type I secretion periplasmic adaptor subunit [Tatumella sp. JGM130]|nr:HlyD family type I secretion periplasmic adaptor subunit [Tatumella sp. JGM130]
MTLNNQKSPTEHEHFDPACLLDDSGVTHHHLNGSTRIIIVLFALLLVFIIWACFAKLDEVSTGTGKVIPSLHEQVLQSLDGGILAELYVREGMQVKANQIVARLDPTISESNVGESSAKYRAALAESARLHAEVNNTPLVFPSSLSQWPDLINAETLLYHSRRDQLNESEKEMNQSIGLVQRELGITEGLVKSGAASIVDVLRLQRQLSDLALKLTDLKTQYYVDARQQMAKADADVQSLAEVIKGRADTLDRLTIKSPVRGVVKSIKVTTIGGVIPPNGELMQIVPMDDRLLIEARLSPRDIAFIHPGQSAMVKITAYDYSIYGGLPGKVESISPDTIQDEAKPEIYYYRVYIRTEHDFLTNKAGQHFSIVPGMISTVDIKTGQKTVMQYLIKPFNKMKEALRER